MIISPVDFSLFDMIVAKQKSQRRDPLLSSSSRFPFLAGVPIAIFVNPPSGWWMIGDIKIPVRERQRKLGG